MKLNQVCISSKKCRYVPANMMNVKMHWAEKAKWKKAWEEEVLWAVYKNRKKFGKLPLQYAKVKIIFHHIKVFDKDGMYSAAKPIVDGLVKAGVIVDDSPRYIDLTVTQKKANKVIEQCVEIKIT